MYYITPPKYGFNLSIGIGYLNYYLPPSLIALSHNVAVKPTTSVYWILGFAEEVRIAKRLHIEMKGTFRNVGRYSILYFFKDRVINFEPSLGIRYDMNFNK